MVRPGFKFTEAGEIPGDWDARCLGSLTQSGFTICYGIVQVGPHVSGGVPVLAIKNLENPREEDLHRAAHSIERNYVRSRTRAGDVLVSVKGTTGRVGLAPDWFDGNVSRDVARIRIADSAEPRFVYHALRSPLAQARLASTAVGTTRQELSIAPLKEFHVALPLSRSEQALIATALTDADTLIESLEHLLAKKRAIKQGARQSLLTGAKRLPGFSEPWAEVPLRYLADCHRGVSYSPISDLSAFETGATVRLLRANNVQNNRVELEDLQFVVNSRVHEHQRLRKDDILLCMANGSRALVGKAARFEGQEDRAYTFGAFMGCLRPKNPTVAKFIYFTCLGDAFQKQVSVLLAGSSINNLSPGSVEGFRVTVPCDPFEQVAIAEVLSDHDADLDATTAKLHKARAIKQGMMQELLTGRIRLV